MRPGRHRRLGDGAIAAAALRRSLLAGATLCRAARPSSSTACRPSVGGLPEGDAGAAGHAAGLSGGPRHAAGRAPTRALSEAEKKKLKDELAATRERAARQADRRQGGQSRQARSRRQPPQRTAAGTARNP